MSDIISYKECVLSSGVKKGDLILLNSLPSLIKSYAYRVLNVNGNIAEVVSMLAIPLYSKYLKHSSDRVYENGPIDTYLTSTWFNYLGTDVNSAIVPKTIVQDAWSADDSGSPVYIMAVGTDSKQLSKISSSFGNEITRSIYALSVQDIIDYFGVTPEMTVETTTLTSTALHEMISYGYQETVASWLRSASSTAQSCFDISTTGVINPLWYGSQGKVHPAFQIDLTKTSWTKTTISEVTSYKSYVWNGTNEICSVKDCIPWVDKGSIIDISLREGTTDRFRVLKANGSIAEVVQLTDAVYDGSVVQIQFATNTNVYEDGLLDTFLNDALYSSYTATAKSAIVDKTFYQDNWTSGTASTYYNITYKYNGTTEMWSQVNLVSNTYGNSLTRHIYTISLQDIIDYVEATPAQHTYDETQLNTENIEAMLDFKVSGTPIWLMSAGGYSSMVFSIKDDSVYRGDITSSSVSSNFKVRPAMQIDLSKIPFTLVEI